MVQFLNNLVVYCRSFTGLLRVNLKRRQLVSVLLLWFVSSVSLLVEASGHENRIFVGGDNNYPPYEFINEAGEPDGYNTELTRAIAEVMGMDVEINLGNWDMIRKSIEAGEIQALQGMVYSEGRAKIYSFSPPHTFIYQSIFARTGTAPAKTVGALRGKQVIVQKGGSMHDYLVNSDAGADLILVATHADALRLLSSGKHDYALVNNLPGLYFGRKLELTNIVPVGQPVPAQHYGYSVLKGNEELLARFSEGLAIVKNTGRQQEIYDKWLGALQEASSPWKKIGLCAAVASALLLLLLGGIVIWNRVLTREVARRTRELRLQQQQLIQADKMTSLGILVSGVAHEINNPSSLLLLNLSVLKDVYLDLEEMLEARFEQQGDFTVGGLGYSRMRDEIPLLLDDMLAGTHRIQRIVDDLRDFARQGPADLTETVDLNQVLTTVIRLLDNTIRKSTNHFEVSYDAKLPQFKGNAQRIEQVVINLIVNACQALESVDQSIVINTRYRPQSRVLCLEIQDHGRGIEPENLTLLSDPFYTTKREQGGTGLGLSISTSIVQEHGGKLVFDSAPGQGTLATLSLSALKGTS